ncbi:hypothetical protein [Sphingomonas paucimobilis]|uniref:Uncharacterized protein n=1 Tax=Sphingomonas paucimobilis TaxID=13689 RepID=A0A7Y2KL55_SPHPI|nr:hypothetical protein [Sphingomonas paucimobilis]EPE61870.1 putative membrane protein [Exiguobacterium sp. S17]NNG55993.1 hypothetical protein [Sphingomonas paucimobilis]
MLRSAAINTIFSAVLKAGGFAYTLLIVGVAARTISIQETSRLLLIFGYLVPLGLVQAGIGALVLRSAMHNHVINGSIAGTHEIGLYFRLTTTIASIVALVVVFAAPMAGLGFIIPTTLIILVGLICSVADQTWFATEQAWVVNICLALSFTVMAAIFITLRANGHYNLTIIAIITYCAPSFASMLSFAIRLRDPIFRGLLVSRGQNLTQSLRAGAPLFLVSVASSILVALPTISTFWPSLPALTTPETPLFRLATISANLAVALLVPFLPWIVLQMRGPNLSTRRIMGQACVASAIAGIIAGGYVLVYILPWIVHLWIGIDIAGLWIVQPWAFIVTLWIAAALSGQLALMLCDALAVAAVVAICDAIIFLMLMAGVRVASITVSTALIVGLVIHTALALLLMYRTVVLKQLPS